jgi:arylsulfatase A-like enzyme
MQYLINEGELENTLFLFMGDNGNPFPREKTTLYDSGIATPLLMHWPARFEKRDVYTGLVSLVDLAPTVLEAVGVPIPEDMQGVSLLKQLAAPGDHGREYIFAEKNWHDFEDHSRAVRDDRYKYIRNAHADRPLIPAADVINSPTYRALQAAHEAGELTDKQQQHFTEHRAKEELYDLDRDPLEFNNLADDPAQEETLERLRGALDRWIKETGDVTTDRTREDQFDPVSGDRIRKK